MMCSFTHKINQNPAKLCKQLVVNARAPPKILLADAHIYGHVQYLWSAHKSKINVICLGGTRENSFWRSPVFGLSTVVVVVVIL